jgi:hypothetical protein
MLQNNNLSVLPWYTSIDEQNHRKSYAYGEVYPLFCQAGMLLPFQIIRPTRSNAVSRVRLYKLDGTLVATLTSAMLDLGLQVVRFQTLGYDIILYPAILPISSPTMLDGQYYMTLYDGVTEWYSEVFTVVQDVSPYLKIEWYDEHNLQFEGGQIIYDTPRFHNFLYFAVELGKPDYGFTEEGEQRDGYYFPEKQLSEKTYKCTVLAPEFLCDVMRLIRLSDYVRVTDKYGRVYDCDQFLITPKWETQGDLASVEIEFETATVVKKIGDGMTVVQRGDFNEDYSDDYLNS